MIMRAQAVGMASQTQNVANSTFQQFFPIFLANDGFYTFYMFAAINFLLAAITFLFIPETKKVSLEENDAFFRDANHVVQGEEVIAQQKIAQAANKEQQYEKPGAVTVENVEGR